MTTVVQPWVAASCTLKQQTVLLCALRGCDGTAKEDPSKRITRHIRHVVLESAEGGGSLFHGCTVRPDWVEAFCSDMDHYPLHWVCHVMHAAEIIGYKHPDRATRILWLQAYRLFCGALHTLPESEAHLDLRLADRDYTDEDRREYDRLGDVAPVVETVEKIVRVVEHSRGGYGG